jgi:transcriptional regulator with XRE-family HTH domain
LVKDIGLLIQKERLKQGISIRELAKKVGCSGRAIQYIEQSKRNPSFYMANDILDALGISIIFTRKKKG